MSNSNEIELSRLYEEITFVILMAYDHHKRSKALMECGRIKSASEHGRIVLQNAERLQATIAKVIAGLDEDRSPIQCDWTSKNQLNQERLGKY